MSETRARLFRGLHAEAAKRGLDHDGLRDVCRMQFEVHSLGDLTDAQLSELFHQWTGKGLRRKQKLPKRGYAQSGELEMVSGEDLNTLGAAFAAMGWGRETQRQFVRRQLSGREEIRTRRDFWKVFSGIRAMQRRSA